MLLVVVLAAPLVGSWEFEPRFEPRDPVQATAPTAELPTAEPRSPAPTPTPTLPESDLHAPDLRWLLVVGAVLAALVVLALLVRLLLWLRRPTPPAPPEPRGLAGHGEIDEEPELPVLHRGVQAAVAHLEQIHEPRDAIVAAWLALEEAAARSGVRRRPAQTPTEFTAAVLTRTGADQEAITRLLRLYHRARFSTSDPKREDVAAATEAFAALTASWPALTEPSQPDPNGGAR
ncbi:protein of unknown function [Ruania alba]|uniref:Protein-glutamine gamma-glutamyltransferase-like C-terminal domain-containing protein n=1 Tax=Ruania alba TaxID=648782 RepID=A0A1H5CXH9_9MICO|nr:protein of unknown function [Ruania alba]